MTLLTSFARGLGQRGAGLARALAPWRRMLPHAEGDVLEPSVYGFILRYSLREQLYLVFVTLLSFPFFYYSLDLPKTIINRAIGGKHFPQEFFGLNVDQIPYLLLLCFLFLLMVLINGWFKYYINVRKGRMGERMLRRLRYALYERVLRFPLSHFDRAATGEIVAMVTAELEPVGGFIGDAFALPISQAGTLITILAFMFIQNPVLGIAAIALYPVQGYVIPKMQRRIRALGRLRVRNIRHLSDRIAESISAQADIRANDGAAMQLGDISNRLGQIYENRFEIYNRKFFVKFLNNLLGQLTPFFFYSAGGYFVITGKLSFGALVAVLAAYKDLSSPWKELLDFYQNQQDVAIKYEQVVEQFHVSDMLDPRLMHDVPAEPPPFAGSVAAIGVGLVDGDGIPLLEGVSVEFPLGATVAIVGPGNSGRNLLPQLLARLYVPTSGRITVGGVDINTLPVPVSGRRIGYVGPVTYLLSASVRANLMLGLRHRLFAGSGSDGAEERSDEPSRAMLESRQSGNSDIDITADWIDYAQAGVTDAASLDARIIEVLRLVDFDQDAYLLGLRGRLDPESRPDIAESLLEARRRLTDGGAESGIGGLVERFDPDRYNTNLPIADNLLFGTPIGAEFESDHLAGNAYVQEVLERQGLMGDLLTAGTRVAETMIELFGDLPPEHDFFEQFSFISADDLPVLERVLAHQERSGADGLLPAERVRLLTLAMKLVAARDRLGLVEAELQDRILAARKAFAEGLPPALRGAVEFFDPARYNAAARLEENILFGTVVHGEAGSRERVQAAIGAVLDALELRETVMVVGLDYLVGSGGARLSPAQRQKVALARATLKRPDLLALNEATAVLEPATEARILEQLKGEFAGRSIVASLSRPSLGRAFDRVLVMDQGRLVKEGAYEALSQPDGPLAPLMAAE